MKLTNKFVMLFLLLTALVLMAFTASPLARAQETTPAVPTLPEWAVLLISAGITWLVTNGLKSLSKTLPWVPTIEGQATALVAALVAFITVFGNGLSMIPAVYHPGVIAFFAFVGTILSAYGVHFTVTQFFPKELPLIETNSEIKK
jgi:hypothetical protein